ncbi:MAG TPA: hypothetical protein VHE37_09190, partial [Nevskiaceae bacterium]|nr:hypothetical protein [Nevskiaceae bacterium]
MTQAPATVRVVTSLEERAALRARRGRKPVDLVVDPRHPAGRDAVWHAIRALRKFTVGDLERATRQPQDTLRSYLQGLQKAGFITRNERA